MSTPLLTIYFLKRRSISPMIPSTTMTGTESSTSKSKPQLPNLISAVKQAKINKDKLERGHIYKCEDSTHAPDDFFQFLPVYVGSMMKQNQEITYHGQCFKDLKFSFEYLPSPENPTSVKVHINARHKKSLLCREHVFLSTTTRHHIEMLFLGRKHTVEFKNLDKEDFDDIRVDGIRTYMFCHGIANEFISVFNTLKLFVGGLGKNPRIPIIGSHVPKYMEKANVKFIDETLGWKLEKRQTKNVWMTED